MTGTSVGPGIAARNASRTKEQIEGNQLKSGRFRPDNYVIATPLMQLGLVYIISSSEHGNLLESKFDCPGFFQLGNKMLLPPTVLMLSQHYGSSAII